MIRALALALLLTGIGGCRSEPPAHPTQTDEWAWTPVDGSQCRDGSPTGVGLRLADGSRDLVVVLDGGGVCVDAASCSDTRANYGPEDFARQMARRGAEGILSPSRENPVGGWNAVFVPYCTGDLHGGSREGIAVDGVPRVQQFVGHENVERALALVASRLDAPTRVVLAGGSAGGFGALLNLAAVARQFPEADLTLLVDSGPFFYDDDVLSPALSARLEALYGLSEAVPGADLGALDSLQALYAHLARAAPDAALGLVSHADDPVIRRYLGLGQRDGAVAPAEYAVGLADLTDRLPSSWDLLLLEGSGHVVIGTTETYRASGVAGWLREALD